MIPSDSIRRFLHRAAALVTAVVLLYPAGLGVPVRAAEQERRTVRIPCGINSLLEFDQRGNPTGYCKAYLDELATVNNWEYEYVGCSWRGAVELLEQDGLDLLFLSGYTSEQEAAMRFSALPGGYIANGLFALSDSGYSYDGFSSFNGARIAVTEGSANEQELAAFAQSRGFAYQPVYMATAEDKIEALETGLVDLAMLSASQEAPQAVLVSLMDAVPFYYAVKAGNDALLTELDRGMQQILKDSPDIVSQTFSQCLVGNNSSPMALSDAEQAFVASGAEIEVGFYEEMEPLAYTTQSGAYSGVYIDLLNYVKHASGLNLVPHPISLDEDWRELLDRGDIDFYIGASSSAATRKTGCRTTQPFMTYESVLITDNDTAFNELQTPTIALTHSRSYWIGSLPGALAGADAKLYRSVKDCLLAVRRGEVDATLLNNLEYNYHSKNNRFSNMHQWETYRYAVNLCLAAAPETNDVLFSSVDKAFGLLAENYVNSVVNDHMNMPYTSATVIDDLYGARYILTVSGMLLTAGIVVFFSARSVRRRQEEAQRQLQKMEKHHLQILAALSRDYAVIYYVNLDEDSSEVVYLENRLRKQPGESPVIRTYSSAMRRYVDTYVLPEYQSALLSLSAPEAMKERFRSEKDFIIRYQIVPNPQKQMYFEAHFVDVSTDEEEHRMVFGIRCVDEITREEQQQKQLLQDALEAANRASDAKTDFLSKMSHDIRTPMNAIIGMTAIAAAHVEDPDRVRDALGKISSSSRHLLGLINEVLDMSKIESGSISLNEEAFNLSDLLNNLLTMVQPQIEEHDLKLEVRIRDIKNEDVFGDSLRIQQAFVNIMGNAVKYTPDGGEITLSVTEKPVTNANVGCYEFVFADTGIGMSPEFLEHIFEPFSRAEDARISKIQGTGLGMAITQNIVRMMNGTIQVESELGKGSTFTVTIFLKLQEPQDLDVSDLQELSVLVVDDDSDVCESTCCLLHEIGMRSVGCTSGQEAVKEVERTVHTPDHFYAAILDWKMPGMDGMETARAIKRIAGDDLPIIILSAYDWSDIELEARAAGVDAFLSKPVFKSGLVRTFRKLRNAEAEPAPASPELQELRESDYTGRRALLVEDNELNREIAQEVLEMAGLQVETAEDGKVAVDRFSASENGWYDIVFMDIQMPVMNGYDAAMAIRSLRRADAPRVPIIAMTANAFAEDVQSAKAAGMNEHIAKPIDFEKLNGVLKKYLGNQ